MPLVCCRRLRNLAPNFVSLGPAFLSFGPALPALLNNDFFQEIIRTYIEKVQDQTLVAPIVFVKARDDFDRLLKP